MIEIVLGLLLALFVALVAAMIGAMFLRAAFKWSGEEIVSYSDAVEVGVIYQPINVLIRFGTFAIAMNAAESAEVASFAVLLTSPFCFLIQAGIIAWRMDVSFSVASKVSLIMWAIGVGILVVAAAVTFVIASQ